MGLTKYKFGELIELTNVKNSDKKYGVDAAIGVNIDKIIMPMRGNISEKDFSAFHLVPPNHFAYNPRGSRKLGLGFNNTKNTYIITFNDNVFRIKEKAKKIILDTYLFMYLSRKEWDRYAEFISWGSSTEVFDWNVFCDIEINLPPLAIQQKYVDIYTAMLANQQSYERGLDDLKLVCDAYIEDLRRKMPCEAIGSYIDIVKESNLVCIYKRVQGVDSSGSFINTRANMQGVNIEKYTVVRKGDISYNPSRINIGSIAIYRENEPCIVSPMYSVFKVNNTEKILPEYLMLWFRRTEFQRYTWYCAVGSVRDTFDFNLMREVKIPIPTLEIQRNIVNIFKVYNTRIEINEKLKAQIKDICPILIKGSIEEGSKTK